MGYTRVDATAGGQNIMVLVPDGYSAGPGAPLILYHHGAGEDDDALLDDALKADCVTALINAGYILAGTNAHGESWGNDDAQADYVALYNYCTANYNVTRVAAWAQSMGGISGLLSIAEGIIPYTHWLGTYPICNLRSQYDEGSLAAAIRTAYGIAGDGSDYAAQTAGHDPVLLSGEPYNVRMEFYASPGDTLVNKAANSDAMAALVNPYAGLDQVVVCSGIHGDPSHFVPADYVSFFAPLAGGASMGIRQIGEQILFRAHTAAEEPANEWWLLEGVSAANCIAAYQAKGAASLAASYVNLANPGTHDAAPGSAPTFDTATGWILNGSSQYLTTGIVGTTSHSIFIRFNGVTTDDVMFGSLANPTWYIQPAASDNLCHYTAGGGATGAVAASGVLGIAGQQAYHDGVAVGGPFGGAMSGAVAAYIGAVNNGGAAILFLQGTIQAVAFYDVALDATQAATLSTAMAAL